MYSDEYESDHGAETFARALGWFSIALGAAELIAPRRVARLIGAPPTSGNTNLLRSYGARELATGIGILTQPYEARWLWSRVGGDAIDLTTLGTAATQEGADRNRLAIAAATVAGVTALDVLCAQRVSAAGEQIDVFGWNRSKEQAVTIKASLDQVEAAWLDWCSSGRSQLKPNYAVRFEPAPGARGTEVHLSGGGSKGILREELRQFKQMVETGEVPVSDGPGLRRSAQPAGEHETVNTIAGVEP